MLESSSIADGPPYNFARKKIGLALANINNDGAVDMATANNSNSVSVFFSTNYGNATFGAAMHYDLSAVASLSALDIDSDGFQDHAVINFTTLYNLHNNGDASFTLRSTTPLYEPTHLGVADVNMDGREDIVMAQGFATYVISFMNQGDTTFVPSAGTLVNFTYGDLRISDFNGDGYVDVI